MVFLEAASHHLPVVSYRHGGVPEAVLDGRTGLLAEEGNVADLAKNIGIMLSDGELAQAMGLAGHARAVAEFNILTRTRELEARVYETVANA